MPPPGGCYRSPLPSALSLFLSPSPSLRADEPISNYARSLTTRYDVVMLASVGSNISINNVIAGRPQDRVHARYTIIRKGSHSLESISSSRRRSHLANVYRGHVDRRRRDPLAHVRRGRSCTLVPWFRTTMNILCLFIQISFFSYSEPLLLVRFYDYAYSFVCDWFRLFYKH